MMIVALSAGFASCSNDDDFDSANLVGTWQSTWSEGWAKDPKNPTDDGEWNEATTGEDVNTMTFNADGTGIDGDGDTFIWKLDGDVITTVYGKNSSNGKVLKLTKTELVVESTYKEGTFETYSKDTFKKVK